MWIDFEYWSKMSFSMDSCLIVRILWINSTANYQKKTIRRDDEFSLTVFAVCKTSLDSLLKTLVKWTPRQAVSNMRRNTAQTIIVSCQLKNKPKIKPKAASATVSQINPSLVPTICWKAATFDDRRTLIAPELFSGRSKYAVSSRRRHENVFMLIRSVSFVPDSVKIVYYSQRKTDHHWSKCRKEYFYLKKTTN